MCCSFNICVGNTEMKMNDARFVAGGLQRNGLSFASNGKTVFTREHVRASTHRSAFCMELCVLDWGWGWGALRRLNHLYISSEKFPEKF